jgi:acid phosphatase type 7
VTFGYRGGTAVLACLACLLPAGANADDPAPISAKRQGASIALSARAGAPGDVVRLVGRRFPRRARVRVTFDARRVLSVRTGRRGEFAKSFALPSRPAGRYALVARSGRVRVGMRFRIFLPTPSPLANPTAPPVTPAIGPSQPPDPPPAPPPEPKTLVAAGDIVCSPNSPVDPTHCQHKATSDRVLALDPDAVATLGDNQYELGQLAYFETEYEDTWGRFIAKTNPALGNHEYEGDPERDEASGYFDYFNGAGVVTGDRDKGYYRWSLGSWTLFALNSGALDYALEPGGPAADCWPVSCAANSAQVAWLRAELEALPVDACVIAYWHHPRFTSGSNGVDIDYPETAPIFQALYEHGVELALTAHAHNYERLTPVDPLERPDAAAGVRQFVVGTGGRSVYKDDPGRRPTTEELITDAFGVLELTLWEDSYGFRFVDEDGTVLDRSVEPESCHNRPGT